MGNNSHFHSHLFTQQAQNAHFLTVPGTHAKHKKSPANQCLQGFFHRFPFCLSSYITEPKIVSKTPVITVFSKSCSHFCSHHPQRSLSYSLLRHQYFGNINGIKKEPDGIAPPGSFRYCFWISCVTVSSPTMPSALIFLARWNASTLALVLLPK